MSLNIAPKSFDTDLNELMRDVSSGRIQLPEFQRNWTWDDNRIIGILASLSQGYPMGAIMRLEYGNETIKFRFRTIEGVTSTRVDVPDFLILDGQQRLTLSSYSNKFYYCRPSHLLLSPSRCAFLLWWANRKTRSSRCMSPRPRYATSYMPPQSMRQSYPKRTDRKE